VSEYQPCTLVLVTAVQAVQHYLRHGLSSASRTVRRGTAENVLLWRERSDSEAVPGQCFDPDSDVSRIWQVHTVSAGGLVGPGTRVEERTHA
jgi:hypothetical protein